jgi:hypothetical protein
MLFELRRDICCSHGPVGRSHIAGQFARWRRATGPWLRHPKVESLKLSAPEN